MFHEISGITLFNISTDWFSALPDPQGWIELRAQAQENRMFSSRGIAQTDGFLWVVRRQPTIQPSNRPRLPAAQSFEGFVATSPAVTTRAVQTEPLRATTATAPTMPDTAVPIGRETKIEMHHEIYEIHHLYIYKYVLQHCSFCSIYLNICFIDFDWTGWLQLSIFSSINVFPQSNAWSFSVAHSCALEEWSVVKEKNQWTLFRNTLVFTPENCLCLSMQSQRVFGLTTWPYSQKGFKSAATSGWGIAFPLEEPRLFSTHMALDVGCFGQQGVCAWSCIVLSLCQGYNQPTAGFQGHWHLVASASNIKPGTKMGKLFRKQKKIIAALRSEKLDNNKISSVGIVVSRIRSLVIQIIRFRELPAWQRCEKEEDG